MTSPGVVEVEVGKEPLKSHCKLLFTAQSILQAKFMAAGGFGYAWKLKKKEIASCSIWNILLDSLLVLTQTL